MVLILLEANLFSVQKDAEKGDLIGWWKLESSQDEKIREEAGKKEDSISGNHKQVKGVSGKAIRFDGFTTCITRKAKDFPAIGHEFAVEAWVAPAANGKCQSLRKEFLLENGVMWLQFLIRVAERGFT